MRRPVGVRRMAQPRIQVAVRITLTGHRVPATTVMGEAGVRELMGITGLTLRVTARRNRVPGMAITVQVTIMVREITALAMIVRGITSQATTVRLSPATTITVPGTLSRVMVLTIPERVTGIVPVAITAPGMRDSVRGVLRRRSGIMPLFTTMFFGHFCRPVPPPRWHYRSGGPVFGTILGVALGTAIGASINALVNSGYNVSSYGNDVIYLSNVPQMNYTWPDAALYYNNGVLTGSQFTYPSAYYDMSRYNSLYNTFTAQYGMPVQTVNQGGIMSATWYGPANRFVTLSFNSQYGGNFYTTLSFGN